MPSISTSNKDKSFTEISQKCTILGLTVSLEDFKKNPDKFIRAAALYDDMEKDYIFRNGSRLSTLQEEYARREHLPDFIAMVRARETLADEARSYIGEQTKKRQERSGKKSSSAKDKKSLSESAEMTSPVEKKKRDEAKRPAEISVEKHDDSEKKLKEEKRELRRAEKIAAKKAKAEEKARKQAEKEARQKYLAERKAHQKAMEAAKKQAEQERKRVEKLLKNEQDKTRKEERKKRQKAKRRAWRIGFKKQLSGLGDKLKKLFQSGGQSMQLILSQTTDASYHNLQKGKRKIRLFSRFFKRRKQQKIIQIQQNIEKYKSEKLAEKKARIIAFKKKAQEKGRKPLKYAAVTLPIATLGYLGGHYSKNLSPVIDLQDISLAKHNFSIPKNVMDTAENCLHNAFNLTNIDQTMYCWMPVEEKSGINEEDFSIQIPFIKNDILQHTPNVDFFNYCFDKSNQRDTQIKYGISQDLYDEFMKENRSVANMYHIRNYNRLSFDDARIIAKTQIYDKYGIGYMQNRSFAAYFYNTLLENKSNCKVSSALARSISDFYEAEGKTLPEKQKNALERIIASRSINISVKDWRQLTAAVNATAVDPAAEGRLFAAIQTGLYSADYDTPFDIEEAESYRTQSNSLFAYEPTFKQDALEESFADNSFLTIAENSAISDNEYEKIMTAQKDKDMEIFSKIYMQCCYDNFVKLEYGNKNQTFREANNALRRYGLGGISRGLHCAGMSMASLCQAADIFTEENPNSHVSVAIKEILENCRNVHSCGTLKADLGYYTQSVTQSRDLEKDIKAYMKENKHAIVFGWAARGKGKFHHQTFFQPAEVASKDAYTYCAYNRQHWGNENTFAKYMRSRARYGKGGYFADIGGGINKIAEKHLQKAIADYKSSAKEEKKVSTDVSAVFQALGKNLFGR